MTQDESMETDLNEEGQNQNEFKEVMKMLGTFISNSNESLYANPKDNDSNEYSHGKESSVIIKDVEEDNPPIIGFRNESGSRFSTNSFSPSLRRFGLRNTNNNSNSVIITNTEKIKNNEKSNENILSKTKSESDTQPEKRIMNRISFYEKMSNE